MVISATKGESEIKPIDMSVRLWSDERPLKPFLDEVRLRTYHLFAPDASPAISQMRSHLQKRHHASIAHHRGRDDHDVASWLDSVLCALDGGNALVKNLREGEIEGVVWIAVMADGKTPLPRVDADLVRRCKTISLKVLLESYNDADETGAPSTHWLTDPQPPGAPYRRSRSVLSP